MKNKYAIIFSLFFFGVLLTVPLVQAYVELSKKESVQFFNIFEDTFITPFATATANEAIFKKAINEIERPQSATENTNLLVHLEESRALIEDVKRSLVNVNKYITDSTSASIATLDTLLEHFTSAENSLNDTPELAGVVLDSLIGQIKQARTTLSLTPIQKMKLPVTHFFKYTVFNKAYLRKYEKEMENSSVFALTIRPVVQFIRYAVLNDVGDKAISGKKGWLFYKPDVEYLYRPKIDDPRTQVVDYNDKVLSDDPVAAIATFRDQLAAMGIELLVVIVPGKPSIYPDLIDNSQSIEQTGAFSHSVSLLKKIEEKGVPVADLFHPFLEERKNDSLRGDSLYLRTDTHWKTKAPRLAAKIAAEAVLSRQWFSQNKRSIEYTIDSIDVLRTGDVGTMTKLTDFSVRDLTMSLPLEKTKCYQVFSITRDDSGAIAEKRLYKDDYRGSRILVLGDSFSRIYQTDEPGGAGWIAHLAYELSEPVASIVNDGGASTIVREILARKASLLKGKKMVIWEFVERDFRFGAEGWKDVPLR